MAILAGASLVAAAAAAPLAVHLRGSKGLVAVLAATTICLVAGILAMVLTAFLQSPELVFPRVVLGMLVRMGLPLAVVAAVCIRGGLLAEGGFVYYVLAFYMVMLAAGTALDLSQLDARAPRP
jgi:hypothetical protein